MDWEFETPRSTFFFEISSNDWVFRAENPFFFCRDFLGDHFARVESSGNKNQTMLGLHFHVCFVTFDRQQIQKSKVYRPPSNQGFPGPCPDDRAHNSVQDSLNQSSVRPNPTLVFAKVFFQNTANPVPVPPVRFERPVPPVQVLNRPVERFKVRFPRFLFLKHEEAGRHPEPTRNKNWRQTVF